ncbi:hypothetical protein D3C87_1288640 [compost metagenome]
MPASRASSSAIQSSARRCLIAWLAPMARSNWRRSRAYAAAMSNAADAAPSSSAERSERNSVMRVFKRRHMRASTCNSIASCTSGRATRATGIVGSRPTVADMPDEPGMPDVPEMPDMPDVPAVPPMPDKGAWRSSRKLPGPRQRNAKADTPAPAPSMNAEPSGRIAASAKYISPCIMACAHCATGPAGIDSHKVGSTTMFATSGRLNKCRPAASATTQASRMPKPSPSCPVGASSAGQPCSAISRHSARRASAGHPAAARATLGGWRSARKRPAASCNMR